MSWFRKTKVRQHTQSASRRTPLFIEQLEARLPLATLVNATAYRPTTDGLAPTAISEALEETLGAGIRWNGDDDNGNRRPDRQDGVVTGENDLTRVALEVDPAATGVRYVLRRSDTRIQVWNSSTKGAAFFASTALEVGVRFQSGGSGKGSVWVEYAGLEHGVSFVALVARDAAGTELNRDSIRLYSFQSVVVAFGGRGANPGDQDPNGAFQIGAALYEQGYDVHMYNQANTAMAYAEVRSAIQTRGVKQVAIFGHSYGGSATYALANSLNTNRQSIGTFTIVFTGYIDAVVQGSTAQETRLPPGTQYHVNYYQENGPLELGGGPVPGAHHQVNVTQQPWGVNLGHTEIDNDLNVRNGIRDLFLQKVTLR